MPNSPSSWRSSLRTSVETALLGALAGGVMGALAQVLYRYPGDLDAQALSLDEWGRGALIGAGCWAALAAGLGVGWRWAARGSSALSRWARGSVAAGLVLAGSLVVLFVAGRGVLGFSRDFTILQALYLAGVGGCGAWLMGELAASRGSAGK